MDTRRFVIATVVGGIALWATGYLMFDVAFASFYAANAGSASGVMRDMQLIWAMVLSNMAYAVLVVFAMTGRGDFSLGRGMKVGAMVGFLLWFTADFLFYGSTNIANLTRTVIDPFLEIVHGGIGGGVIAAVLARSGAPSQRQYQTA